MSRPTVIVDGANVRHYALVNDRNALFAACQLVPSLVGRIALRNAGVPASRVVTCLRCVQLVD